MRLMTICAGFILFVAAGAFANAAGPTDQLCPSAVPSLNVLYDTPQSDLAKVTDAARNVAAAYDACATTARSNADVEPRAHYDHTRYAQYVVLVGRALAGQQKFTEARAAFTDARKTCADVVDYISPNRLDYGRPSRYHDACVEIRDAAIKELAALSASPAPEPAPTRT